MEEDVAADCSCDTVGVGSIDSEEVPGPSSVFAKDVLPTITDTPRSPSPEPEVNKCAICLGDLVNKSYSNSCLHQFCFGCLLEWSKIKPECPLCKSVFRTIIHNIRTNTEFDEYVVPPNPENSFDINPMAFANVYPSRTHSDSFYIGHGHHHSTEDHGYSMSRPARMDRMDHTSRFIRILEMGTGISDAFDTFMHSISPHRYQHPNPFISEHPETFGSSLHLPNSPSSSSNQAGYQNRKRVYERNTWISPFNSTLQPGSVFFPSVEYFRTHPIAIHRLTPWLFREIQVLLGLRFSQAEMANAYSIIIDLIRRYDIRSPEFREFLKGYFGNHVRQFTHEFYHFVLSGMRIDEYDRTAVYPSPSTSSNNNNQPSTSSSTVVEVERSPYDEPQVITISSSDSENEENIIPTNLIRTSSNKKIEDIIVIDSDSDDDNVEEIDHCRNGDMRNRFEKNLREAKDLHRDLLEILDVGVDIIDDPDNTPAQTASNNNHEQSSEIRDSRSNGRDANQDFLLNTLLERDREESTIEYPIDLSSRPSRFSRDQEHNRGINLGKFYEDFKRSYRENGEPSSTHHSNSNSNRHERKRNEASEIYHSTIERPPRPRSPSYPSPIINIYSSINPIPGSTANIDFRWSSTGYDFNRPVTSSNILQHHQTSNNDPPKSSIGYTTTTMANKKDDAAHESSDSDICEYLGIHPIEKPPPLAIITISDSDDEKEDEKPSTSAAALAELKIKNGDTQNKEQSSKIEYDKQTGHQNDSSEDDENSHPPRHYTRLYYKKNNLKSKSKEIEVTKSASEDEAETEPENQSKGSETDEVSRPKYSTRHFNKTHSKPKKRKQKREKYDSDEDEDHVPTKKKSKSKRKRQKREIRSSDDDADEDEDEIKEEIGKKRSKMELRRKSKSPSKKKETSKSATKSKKSKKSKKKKRKCYRQSSSNSSSPQPPIFTDTDED